MRRPCGLLQLGMLVLLVGMMACASPAPKGAEAAAQESAIIGRTFPSVVGESLEGERVAFPEDLAGEVAVLLVGYQQRTQFDIDRWLMGLLQAGVDAQIYEVPTISGLVPTVISGWIDNGMRAGIPEEDWGAVVTLYGGAAKPVAALTGTDRGQNTRVLVLDHEGRVVWFADQGYSARLALELNAVVARLQAGR